ncbi:MAG: NAD-dependent epimerase/dehydratase family protein [bacterium]
MGNNVLITGGAGFLGSSIVREFLLRNSRVIVYDNFYSGSRKFLPKNDNLSIFNGDIRSRAQIKRCLNKYFPSIVIHLAAIPFIPYCDANIKEVLDVNVSGTQAILEECCKMKNLPKFLLASTAAVYKPSLKPHSETDTLMPIEIYGISKLSSEFCIKIYNKQFGIPYNILRIFNAVGPRTTNPYLIPAILRQLKVNPKEIRIGNVTPIRDYIYADDVATAFYKVASLDNRKPEIFNISTGRSFSVNDIIKIIKKLSKKDFTVKTTEKRKRAVDRPIMVGNNHKLKKYNWEPVHSIQETIKLTMSYYGL